MKQDIEAAPPTPPSLRQNIVTLAHGGGGKAMRELIEHVFASVFKPERLDDQARLMDEAMREEGARLAFTTDSFVVDPIEFPGGDIGKIAVCGSVNDLAVGGARPLWLSAGFIIEEGFEIERLQRIVASMQEAADAAGVRIVTGDTKIVGKGSADGIFINTSGVGVIAPGVELGPAKMGVSDVVIVNGELGNHGAAIMAARGGVALDASVKSDCAPLCGLMKATLAAAPSLSMARDATRGGIASALCEIAEEAGLGIKIDEAALPFHPQVKGVCEILGLDPLYLANEGTLVAFVPEDEADAALAAMRSTDEGKGAVAIGRVVDAHKGRVVMKTGFGGERIVDMLVGDQLPRIC